MTVFIVILIVIIIIIYFINITNKQLKYEILKEGGLINIFSNLELALFEADCYLYQNKVTSLEYHNKINDYSFLKLELKKTFDPQNQYQMQMIHVLNGRINQKTIPYIIFPHQTTEEFSAMLLRMALKWCPVALAHHCRGGPCRWRTGYCWASQNLIAF